MSYRLTSNACSILSFPLESLRSCLLYKLWARLRVSVHSCNSCLDMYRKEYFSLHLICFWIVWQFSSLRGKGEEWLNSSSNAIWLRVAPFSQQSVVNPKHRSILSIDLIFCNKKVFCLESVWQHIQKCYILWIYLLWNHCSDVCSFGFFPKESILLFHWFIWF